MKNYVRMAGKSSAPIHIADSPDSTYCQFEKTTDRKLVGFGQIPAGTTLCKNCALLSKKRRPKFKFAAPVNPANPPKQRTNGAVEAGPLPRPWAPDFARPPWEDDFSAEEIEQPVSQVSQQLDAEYRAIMG